MFFKRNLNPAKDLLKTTTGLLCFSLARATGDEVISAAGFMVAALSMMGVAAALVYCITHCPPRIQAEDDQAELPVAFRQV